MRNKTFLLMIAVVIMGLTYSSFLRQVYVVESFRKATTTATTTTIPTQEELVDHDATAADPSPVDAVTTSTDTINATQQEKMDAGHDVIVKKILLPRPINRLKNNETSKVLCAGADADDDGSSSKSHPKTSSRRKENDDVDE